jgi:hypothetical protein
MDAVSGSGDKPPNQADILTEIVSSAELFHTPDTTSYADITVNNHRETWKVRSRGFRLWLSHAFSSCVMAIWNCTKYRVMLKQSK